MLYNYDYFISYAHADNQSEDGKSGFVDEFVEKLRNSPKHQQMFGGKINVFFDIMEIHSMSDWDNRIRSSLASSRFLIVLLSPSYFKSEYCAREFDWWMKHEMHRRLLVKGTTPMIIVDLTNMYDREERDPDDVDIRSDLRSRFPNWLKKIQEYQSDPPDLQFDLHDLDRAKISDALEALRMEAKEKVQRQNDAEKSPYNVQYPRYNEKFVGRLDNLRSLRQYLSSEQETSRFSALIGLGGFGKTELALTYGHAFAWDYQLGRVFANCEKKTSITEILLTSGMIEMNGWEQTKGTDQQQLEILFNHLKAKRDNIVRHNAQEGNLDTLGTHILLILDNVDKLELIRQESLAILPDYFHVIITTRENLNEFKYIHSEPVDRLSKDESVELLNDLRPFGSEESEITAAKQIAQSLDGFTLVVELTGAYLARKPEVTYQQQYERLVVSHPETFQVMADRTRMLTRHSADTVAVVLESTLSALSDNARKALKFAALMPPDAVGFGWLPELVGLDENEGKNILDELIGYSLLTPLEEQPKIARIHRLVADTVKQEMIKKNQAEVLENIVIIRAKCEDLLENDEKFWYTSENSWNITPVSEFFLALADMWTEESSEDEIDWDLTKMMDTTGLILMKLGKLKESLNIYKSIYNICIKRVKAMPKSAKVLQDLTVFCGRIGTLEIEMGYSDSGIEWYVKVQSIYNRMTNNVYDTYDNFLKTYQIQEETIPEDVELQRHLSIIYKQLGKTESNAGNASVAINFYEKALEIDLNLVDKMPEDIESNYDLCILFEELGDLCMLAMYLSDSREYYYKALKIRKWLINKMPDNIDAYQGLSDLYNRFGDLDKLEENIDAARLWYVEALEIRNRLVDKTPEKDDAQFELSVLYINLADLENDAGNIAAAKKYYKKALEIRQLLTVTWKTIDLSFLYAKLGELEKETGDIAAACKWYKMNMEFCKLHADQMPENVEAQLNLSNSYERLGEIECISGNVNSARKQYKKALKICQSLAAKMPENFKVQCAYFHIYTSLGDLERTSGNTDAERKFYKKALVIAQQPDYKIPDEDLSILYLRLGFLKEKKGNIVAAKKLYRKSMKIHEKALDTFSWNEQILHNLSIIYYKLGYWEKTAGNITIAYKLYKKALKISHRLEKIISDNAAFQKYLSLLYQQIGNLEELNKKTDAARKCYRKALELDQRLADLLPDKDDIQRDLIVSYERLGDLENAAGNAAAARGWYEKSLEILQWLVDKSPDNVEFQKDLAKTQEKLTQIQKP